MPLRFFVTEGTTADCKLAGQLIEGLQFDYLLADKGYDTDEIVNMVKEKKAIAVIPPKSNRKEQRAYDQDIYKQRHLVENAFAYLKRWRGIATRYAKRVNSFVSAVQIACINWWLRLI